MSTRGRPKSPDRSVRIVLSGWLHPEYDADIIAWLNSVPRGQRMSALKAALRNGGLGPEQSFSMTAPDEAQAVADDLLSNWEY